MTPLLDGWPTKAIEAPSLHEVRLALLDTNPVFQSLRDKNNFFDSNFYSFLLNFYDFN